MEKSNSLLALIRRRSPPPPPPPSAGGVAGGSGSVEISSTSTDTPSPPPPQSTGVAGEIESIQVLVDGILPGVSTEKLRMQRAIMRGDRKLCISLLKQSPTLITESLSHRGDRLLHLCVAFGHEKIFDDLLQNGGADPAALLATDGSGLTVASYASILGSISIAKTLVARRRSIFLEPDRYGITPLERARVHRHKELFDYLLNQLVKEDLDGLQRKFDLLVNIVKERWFDTALSFFEKDDRANDAALLDLISKMEPCRERMQPIETILDVFCTQRRTQKKALKNLTEQLLRNAKVNSSCAFDQLRSILTEAVKKGNIELLCNITSFNPDFLLHQDEGGHTIFHTAIIYRQMAIFDLLDHIGVVKDVILDLVDKNGNTVLHLAAASQLNPPENLLEISYLSSERTWFEGIKKMVPSFFLLIKNGDGKTPDQLFYECHQKFQEAAVAWTKNFSQQGILVTALMFTVMFPAIFTVPGGLKSETGVPLLRRLLSYKLFLSNEFIAMSCSGCGTMMFISLHVLKHTPIMYAGKIQRRLYLGLLFMVIALIASTASFFGGFLVALSGTHKGLQLFCTIAYLMVLAFICYRVYRLGHDISVGTGKIKHFFLRKYRLVM